MAASPEVTVVIPTRSRWRRLATAIAAALRQEAVELELVVVDDGSTDETPRRLAELHDPRLRTIRNDTPNGVSAARNRGIGVASGEWIAFLDDDDVWAPQKLRRQLDAAAAADAAFAYSAVLLLDDRHIALRRFEAPEPEALERQLLANYAIPAGSSNVIARASLVRELGGFDESFVQIADWDLWLRLARVSRAAACPEPHVGYVEHPGNMVVQERRDVREDFRRLSAKHLDAGIAHGVKLDTAGFASWVAVGHRRAGRPLQAARILAAAGISARRPELIARAGAAFLPDVMAPWRSKRRRPLVEQPSWLDLYR